MTRAVNLTLRTAEYIGAFGLIGVILILREKPRHSCRGGKADAARRVLPCGGGPNRSILEI